MPVIISTFIIFLTSVTLAQGKPGALIHVQMQSTVGILLDELPALDQQRVVAKSLNRSSDYWNALARRQIEMTLYRLVYRNAYFKNKGRLPLPPKKLWRIDIGKPSVRRIDSHKLLSVPYTLNTVLLASADLVRLAEPALATVGGVWNEPFVLPVDPEFILERTGYACMDEVDYPPNSVDSENAKSFYDHTCSAGNTKCHTTKPFPKYSCNQALQKKIGRIATEVRFKRLPWSEAIANEYRIGNSVAKEVDLEVVGAGLENNRLIYRYIPANSCAIVEGCVAQPGWRRLLQFDGSIVNRSSSAISLGIVSSSSVLVQQHMFEQSACHGHFHFSHYGNFSFGYNDKKFGSKKAFCLESTSRYLNNEETPLTHDYNCENQGIEAGWGDDYIAGIECQWIDITDIHAHTKSNLAFQFNPDQFLCEGKPILDSNDNFTFVPTKYRTESGDIQNRIACDFSENWDANNFQSRDIFISNQGSYVTDPCRRGQVSPLRNCGFKPEPRLRDCDPGATVKLSCRAEENISTSILRICESSRVLKAGIACSFQDSLFNAIVGSSEMQIEFNCPMRRDNLESGGQYAIYFSSIYPEDSLAKISCKEIR